ncbi:MAG: elongation factor G [Firmicutes bacterium]|nr:elongation factor G [Bacillota bacterium]HOB34801.1 elongation factor G [Bacillota bacterium]HPZ91049.1 elongation factor G [Bacillota bacterium]HQE02078.1 elongation factor G [Bacillota bacterium]
MKSYSTDKIRNISIVGHGGSGKTILTESMLFASGAIQRLGRVEDGTTTTDFDPDEIKRQISISAAMAPVEWKDCKLNLIDTPGYFDFVGEVISSMRVTESALVNICAVSGVEVGTEKVWKLAEDNKLPRICFVNKMDRENANFEKVLNQARDMFGSNVVPVQIPIGSEDNFQGMVDLLQMKAVTYRDGKQQTADIPAELAGIAQEYREQLVEIAAETDDELTMKYLEGEELTEAEIISGIQQAVKSAKLFPVLCGSATKGIGIAQLMDFLVFAAPGPADKIEALDADGNSVELPGGTAEPFRALVFKTMADPYVGKVSFFRVYSGQIASDTQAYNLNKGKTERIAQIFLFRGKNQIPVAKVVAGDIAAVAKLQDTSTGDTLCDKGNKHLLKGIQFPIPMASFAVEPKSKNDEEKVSSGLARFLEEDPTFRVERNAETKQTLIYGMGDTHLEIIVSRLANKFGVEVELTKPKIPYRETIRGTAEVEGKHKKQTGGRGQYGHVKIIFEPLPRGQHFEFVDKIFGGAVPKNYIPAVEKGLIEAMEEGVLAGFPAVDIKATLIDGSYHSVDSSEMAFKIAASLAYKKGMMEANPVLLEPIVNVEVKVPENFMGDIMGDLNSRRGKIMGMEPQGDGTQVIRAQVPMAEMYKYSVDLRSMTQGRGEFTMSFSHYEEVPANIAEKVIEEHKKQKEE